MRRRCQSGAVHQYVGIGVFAHVHGDSPEIRAKFIDGYELPEARDIADAIATHLDWLASSGNLRRRRTARARDEITALVIARLRARMGDLGSGGRWCRGHSPPRCPAPRPNRHRQRCRR